MVTAKEVLQIQYDKKQLQFAVDGTLCINKKVIDEQTPLNVLINEKNFWICPFCLEKSNKFEIENKGLIKCPNCNNFMKLKTLVFIKDCSNVEYAKWVYDYRLSGFFKKVNFEKWNIKMKELGISYEFWDEYKKLKGESQQQEKPNKELNDYIELVYIQLKAGMTKDKIILESYNYNIEDLEFHYAFNEAELRIKKEQQKVLT